MENNKGATLPRFRDFQIVQHEQNFFTYRLKFLIRPDLEELLIKNMYTKNYYFLELLHREKQYRIQPTNKLSIYEDHVAII